RPTLARSAAVQRVLLRRHRARARGELPGMDGARGAMLREPGGASGQVNAKSERAWAAQRGTRGGSGELERERQVVGVYPVAVLHEDRIDGRAELGIRQRVERSHR